MVRKLVVFLFFLPQLVLAQDISWAHSIGGTSGSERSNDIIVDDYGNTYITGRFSGVVDFDPGPGIFTLGSGFSFDLFVQKLDVEGNFVWAKSIGGTYWNEGESIKLDNDGNVYITGRYSGIVDFDPGDDVYTVGTTAAQKIFVLKLDEAGEFIWVKSIEGVNSNVGYSMSIDGVGNSYITGYFTGTADFDSGLDVFNLESPGYSKELFVLKLDVSGNFIWAKAVVSDPNEIVGNSICIDAAGNCYIVGYYEGTVDFDPGAGIYNLTSNGIYDSFIQKLDENGDFIWAKSIGGTSLDKAYSIDIDEAENIYITGFYEGTVDFDPGATIYNLEPTGGYDVFIEKLDSDGNFIWARSIGGSGTDFGKSILVDPEGDLFCTGEYSNTVDFDPTDDVDNRISTGVGDVFIEKFDSDGNFIWVQSFGSEGNDIGEGVTVDGLGNIFLTGTFTDTISFAPFVDVDDLETIGSEDIFIIKLAPYSSIGIENYGNQLVNSPLIYPNPAQNSVTLELESLTNVSIKLYAINGDIVHSSGPINNPYYQFELNQESGVYIVEIISDQANYSLKLIKE